ncbi:hypothetical protein NFI96_032903, partial [Prochilodus magdalenae]
MRSFLARPLSRAERCCWASSSPSPSSPSATCCCADHLGTILIKLNAVHFSYEYYTTQVYVFPVTVCLGATPTAASTPYSNCLMRREFRKALKRLFWQMASPTVTTNAPLHGRLLSPSSEEQGGALALQRAHLSPASSSTHRS